MNCDVFPPQCNKTCEDWLSVVFSFYARLICIPSWRQCKKKGQQINQFCKQRCNKVLDTNLSQSLQNIFWAKQKSFQTSCSINKFHHLLFAHNHYFTANSIFIALMGTTNSMQRMCLQMYQRSQPTIWKRTDTYYDLRKFLFNMFRLDIPSAVQVMFSKLAKSQNKRIFVMSTTNGATQIIQVPEKGKQV